jgi:hypothetical protein
MTLLHTCVLSLSGLLPSTYRLISLGSPQDGQIGEPVHAFSKMILLAISFRFNEAELSSG